jgi:hypothetical protein
MPTTNLKIGYNARGVWSATVANYTLLDTVTVADGGATSLYEVIAPAYPGVVPTGAAGATGATGPAGPAGIGITSAVVAPGVLTLTTG